MEQIIKRLDFKDFLFLVDILKSKLEFENNRMLQNAYNIGFMARIGIWSDEYPDFEDLSPQKPKQKKSETDTPELSDKELKLLATLEAIDRRFGNV